MMAASGLPVPPPPRMGWVQNLRFSYIFMEPAKTHGIYTVLTSSASETVVFAAFCNTTLYTTTLIVLLLQKQQQLLLLLPLLRTTTYYYVLLRTSYTYYYVLRIRTTTYYVYVLRIRIRIRTTTYYYVLLRMTCRPCLDTYIHTYKQTINQYKQIVIIHKSIETYSYTYTWLQMVRPPQPTHRGGAGTLCVHVVSLCADTKTMTCRPCLDTYIHTYKQTINQYKQIVIIHKSIETYSYTYTWLQMVRPPQPTHRGGAGTLCVHVVSLCADTKTMTCRPCWDTHILTYQQTDRRTHRHTYINQYKHIVIPIHGCICVTYPPFGGWGGTRGLEGEKIPVIALDY